jgi:NAD(P)-dependent dehydrogenase (short-subunit alcohol dehydrogenase family)
MSPTEPVSRRYFSPCHERTIVTGGGTGIGREVALALAEAGGTVYVMGRRAHKLQETAAAKSEAGRIIPVVCDIRDWGSVDRAFSEVEREGPAPAVVHAASDVTHMLAEQITSEIFQAAAATILTGSFHVIQRWGQALRAARLEGVAISYSSATCGRESPAIAHSSATKAGLEALTRTVASEWGRFGLRLNVIAPGLFLLPDTHHADYWQNAGKRVFSHIPLGRSGEVDEIVGPTLFMLSRSARYITGQVVVVDGGFQLLQWRTARPEDFASSG